MKGNKSKGERSLRSPHPARKGPGRKEGMGWRFWGSAGWQETLQSPTQIDGEQHLDRAKPRLSNIKEEKGRRGKKG